jgi:hypothetical protein
MAKNPQNKKRKTLSTAEMLKLQSQLIKDHDAIPGEVGYLNWTPENAREWKTKQQLLLKEKEKLEIELKNSKEEEESSGVTPTTGLKAMGLAAAFGGDIEMTAAVGLLAAGVGKKIFRGLFKKKNEKEESQEEEIQQGEVQKPGAQEQVRKPKAEILKPGFLMSAEDKIRAREERINSEKYISKGTPEKIESDGKSISSDNSVIISILNKILGSFENDNERMRRSIRDTEEKKLESDPTPDTPGSPVKEGDDKKSGMNKLLMFGAIAGLLGLAYTFKDEIAKVLEPITNMLGKTNPLKESNKEDYDFDIMDALGVTALMGMLGMAIPDVPLPRADRGAGGGAERGNARPRHPAGAKNKAGKSIGGQFTKVDPDTIKGVVKKSIKKRAGGALGKVLPGLGLAFGLYDAFTRAKEGDLTGAGIALTAGVVGLAPGLGTGASIALMATNIARDVYNDAYGVYPEADESGEKAKRAEDILKEVVKAISPKSPDKPMTESQRDALTKELTAYSNQIEAERVPGAKPTRARQKLAANLYKKAKGLDIDRETVDTELNELRTAGTPEQDIKANKQLEELTASNAAANAEAAAGGAAAGGAAAGAPSSTGGAPTGISPLATPVPVGAPVSSSPPPASETSGSAVTAATMGASEAQNSVTVLPPIVNNQSNTMKSGNENASKAQKMTMQVRLNDDVFRKAVDSTAAVLKAA